MKTKFQRKEFINSYPPFNVINTREVDGLFDKDPVHLYVHIPFCLDKCGYCYFKSFVDYSPKMVEEYLEALRVEILLYAEMPHVRSRRIKSLYFGGGTPTLLDCHQLEKLVKLIYEKFDFISDYEFCIESNPATITPENVSVLKDLGVTRLSIGMQNFSDRILMLNGREGNFASYDKAYRIAKNAEIKVVNIDIMSGMLGETWDNWKSMIDKLIQMTPENIAFYKMELYYNTQLAQCIRKGDVSGELMSDQEEIKLIRYAYDRLMDKGGYTASNCFTMIKEPIYEHVHRKGLWSGDDMIGFGLTAHSYFNKSVYQNTWHMNEYCQNAKEGVLAIKRAHKISMREKMASIMVYGIKNLYINRAWFVSKFGVDMMKVYGNIIEKLLKENLLILNNEALLVPRDNYIFADDISKYFFLPEHTTMRLAHIPRR